MTELMTPDELAAFEKRLWDETTESLQRQISYKIVNEFAVRHHARTAAIIQAEAAKMVRAEIEARRPELEAHLRAAVDKMFARVNAELETQLAEVLRDLAHVASGRLETEVNRQMGRISTAYFEALRKAAGAKG